MQEFFGNMLLSVMFLVGLGSWAIGRLLNKNPIIKDTATRGAAGLIARFFTTFFKL
jgi:hypothetical protein